MKQFVKQGVMAGFMVMSLGCYNSALIGGIDYALSQCPRRETPKIIRGVSEYHGDEPNRHQYAVLVCDYRARAMHNYARSLADDDKGDVYFFDDPAHFPDITLKPLDPGEHNRHLIAVYRADHDRLIRM